eukprot:TRINITY_DN42081_c0_g1_i1.p1 TRINITY_DN42081_c0_g1~~TRINITY_DN42081_c0_g1_i1.p1  ORF type:complete len:495 (+),score=97.38 TRINITY_DN42081_c0_g1_i1:91-1575(+)
MVIFILIFFLSLVMLWFFTRRHDPAFSTIPGPRPLPIIGNSLMFIGPFEHIWLRTMQDLKNEFGNVVMLYIGTRPQIFLFGSEGFEKILSSSRHITKGFQYQFLWPWLGRGLLTSTGTRWHKHRKLLTPAFHFRILEDFLHIMNDHTEVLVDKVVDSIGQTVDVYNLMTHCALDIICETTMGVSVNAQNDNDSEYVKAVYETSELVFRRMMSPWLHSDMVYHMTEAGIKWQKSLSILQGFTKKVIQERKDEMETTMEDQGEDEDDTGRKKRMAFLDLLIKSSEEGSVLTDQEIQDEVDTFMFEGHDTTASSLAVTIYLIALDKTIQKKCQEELDGIFGSSARAATSEDLVRMKYLTACIKESLRLYGSVPGIGRVTSEPVEIEGHVIPPGTEISLILMVLHRDSKYFPDPEKFDPARFYIDQAQERHPYAYTPFSAGPRNCIGQKFAMMEEKVILSSILRRFNMKAEVQMKDILMAPEIVIKPRNGFPVNFERR